MINLKAITLHPYWALEVFCLDKTIECRSWQTDYRGDLLICSSAKKIKGCISSHALIVCELSKIEPFTKKHLKVAEMNEMPEKESYAWHLTNFRDIIPFYVKGQLRLFDVDDNLIKYLVAKTEEEADENYKKYFEPLFN